MVYSANSRTASIASMINQNQGGGMKKAGLPPTEAISVAQRNAYNSSGGDGFLNLTSMRSPGSVTRRSQHFVGMRFTS